IILASGKVSTGARLLLRRFRAIVNLHGGPTSLAYSALAWGKRIGAEHYRWRKLYNGVVPAALPSEHTVESTMEVFRWLGLRRQQAPALRYEPHPAEAARMQEKIKGRPYVVIHPAALMATKRWEAKRFGKVGDFLAARGFTVVITTGPGEEPL